MEPVRIDVGRHIETTVYHELGKRIAVRFTLVIVPAFVNIPNRSEKDFVNASALIEICTGISVHISGQLLYYDIVCQSLLIKPLSPAVLGIFKIIRIQNGFCLIDEILHISVLGDITIIIFRILVIHIDTTAGIERHGIPLIMMNVGFYQITAGNLRSI